MAIEKKLREQETVLKIEKNKRARTDDRLSTLPDSLQLHILSFLPTKDAVQTSTLSTTWASMWKRIPVLEFNSYKFKNHHKFDNFVHKVLRHRDHSESLERLSFHRRLKCNEKILKEVFDYAFKVGVKQLEVSVERGRSKTWPIPLCSFDSLTSLKLESERCNMSWPNMGRAPRSFKNLTVLHLDHALITDEDPFSGFPVLESLTLIDCDCVCPIKGARKSLNIHGLRLTDITISSRSKESMINCYDLITPKLKSFYYRGDGFPLLRTHDGFPVLENVVIDFNGPCYESQEKLMFDDLLAMIRTLHNVKSLTVFSSIVQLMAIFPDELGKRMSPFWELRDLKLDFCRFPLQNLFDSRHKRDFETCEASSKIVKAYLLRNSPDAKFSIRLPMQGDFKSREDNIINLSSCRCY